MPRRPAIYPRSKPANIGKSVFRRTCRHYCSLGVLPLRLERGPNGNARFPCLPRSIGLKPAAEVGCSAARILNGISQIVPDGFDIGGRGMLRVVHVEQFVEQSKLCVVADVIRHGRNLMPKLLQFGYRTASYSRCCFLVHRVNHDTRVIKSQNAIRLIAMREESAGEGMSRDKRNHRDVQPSAPMRRHRPRLPQQRIFRPSLRGARMPGF